MTALAVILALSFWDPASVLQSEVVAEIRIHGNLATPDDEVRRMAGISIGAAVTPGTVAGVAERLRATNRFRRVAVLKRFASIADPTQIVLVIVVDEGPVRIEMTGITAAPTRVVKSHWPHLLFFPILDAEDGYGLSYGARLALADTLGARSRISWPLTWGGEKKAGAEFDKDFARGPISRIAGGVSLSRRTNPFFDQDDDRRRVWIRGERQLVRDVRVGADAGRQDVSFGGTDDRLTHAGADVTLDTRVDPVLPRNAIYMRAGVERLTFDGSGSATRAHVDARGYAGLLGQTVIAVRATRDASDRPLPSYAKPLLGGMASVRGFHAGTAAGDTLVAGSIELFVPLTSPLHVGRFGVSAFLDAGTVYDQGARFSDQTLTRGAGGSVWVAAAFVRMSVAVAHGVGATTRVHAGGSVLF